MDLIEIYECLCDGTRLRVLNLLCQGPLCVCHFQTLLNQPQVKISKHLKYLRERGLVTARREAKWMIYELPSNPPPELKANLACFQDCAREIPELKRDLDRLGKVRNKFAATSPICCSPAAKKRKAVTA